MANPEHLKAIMKGVETWNSWRKQNIDVRPDLAGADLQNIDLRGAHLRDADLQSAKLGRANLSRADVTPRSGVWIDDVEMRLGDYLTAAMKIAIGSTDLRHENLEFADLDGAHLYGC